MIDFGNINKVNLRKIWNNEAYDFTPWLADNIDVLGESLGIELELTQKEAAVGDFSLDILAKDLGTNRTVIIENQLTPTDHDHLGKLLTYASGFDASTIVWISESIRDEHRQTLEWLNQKTDENTQFFGVVVEVIRIDDSKPAYNFKPVVYPNEFGKSTRNPSANNTSPKMERYRMFFQELIDTLREEYNFTNARKGQPQNFYSFASGISGITYELNFTQDNKARVSTYIDFGDYNRNKAFFDKLSNYKDKVENKFGENLSWERVDDIRLSRVAIYRDGSIDDDMDILDDIKDWAIDSLIRMRNAFGPILKKINSSISPMNNR